jgi:prophage tail gpP-like protein
MGVSLQIEGQTYAGWHAVSVRRNLEQAAATFACAVSERWGGRSDRWVIRPGAACAVLLDGDVVLTGYVDTYEPSFDAGSHSVQITGRSKTADFVDSAAIVPGGQFKQLNLLDIAQRLAAPFGLPVDITDVADLVLGPLADVQIQQGETCHAVVERLCRMQGVLVSDGAAGILRLTRAGRRRATGAIVQGQNILSASATLDVSQRHSEYTVKGQRANTDDRADGTGESGDGVRLGAASGGGPAGNSVRACIGAAIDAAVTRYRPWLLTAETQADDVVCGLRAAWEARRRAGLGVRASVTVAGWRQGGAHGPLWDVNLLVPVVSPWLGIDRDLLIASVEFRKDDSGSTTTLELTVPDAFEGPPQAGAAPSNGWGPIERTGATPTGARATPTDGASWGPIERTGATPTGDGWGPIERTGATPTASGGNPLANADLWAGGFVSLVQRGLGALGL